MSNEKAYISQVPCLLLYACRGVKNTSPYFISNHFLKTLKTSKPQQKTMFKTRSPCLWSSVGGMTQSAPSEKRETKLKWTWRRGEKGFLIGFLGIGAWPQEEGETVISLDKRGVSTANRRALYWSHDFLKLFKITCFISEYSYCSIFLFY